MNKNIRICVVCFPEPSLYVVESLLKNLLSILQPLSESIDVITGGLNKYNFSKNINFYDTIKVLHFRNQYNSIFISTIIQILKIIFIQILMCIRLIFISKKINIVLFYIGGVLLFPPLIIARLFRKKIIFSAIGLTSHFYSNTPNKTPMDIIIAKFSILIERIMLLLSNVILVESYCVKNFLGLAKYKEKVYIYGARYIDTRDFRIKKQITNRKKIVGYFGRLSAQKGVLNFIKSAFITLKQRSDILFLIGGYGELYHELNKEIEKRKLFDKIVMIGKIPDGMMPEYLNELVLLVLPSYSEGLPTIVLESMACGTPVLATPVGGVPDVITHEYTGFILKNNSSECIAESILRILENPELLFTISKNARKLIEEEFSYEMAIARYKKLLNLLLNY